MLAHHQRKQLGLTLIEMMIAMVLGLFVTAVIITVFSTNVRSNVENMKMIRLNQELRGVMTLMVDEIKRHGYSFDSTDDSYMNKLSYNTTYNCLNYSYDSDTTDGAYDSTKDLFAFNLENNIVYWTANSNCSSLSSSQPLTEINIANISALDFDFSGSANINGTTSLDTLFTTTDTSVYEITITLTGTTDLPHSIPANDPRRTITETVRIRNEAPKN